MINDSMFGFLLQMIFLQSILQNSMKTPSLTGECELQNEEMWSIFDLVLKGQIQAKKSGLRLEG
jgi:hypothetical protein